ncbi:MAG: serine/threonine-protein kinase [Acidobacteriota bacterium]
MDEPVQVGRYQVQEVIGKGAMGVVYLAYDPQIGRRVALKTIRPAEGARAEEVAESRERFQREARAAGSLLHPHIVTVFDVFEDRGTLYIAMEYVQGRLLEAFCSKNNLLPMDRAVRLVAQGLSALHYAHRRGIVHRDIKPANLMVLEDEETLKVMDFGVAREEGAHLTQKGFVVGTPHYMSPEQIEGRPLDGRSDVFSMGVVLYELLCGERPFPGESISTVIYRVLHDSPTPLRELNPRIPRDIARIVDRALAKDPGRRFPSAQAFEEALLQFLETGSWEEDATPAVEETVPTGESILPPPPSTGARRRRKGHRSRRVLSTAILLSLLLAGLLAAGGLFRRGSKVEPPRDPFREELPRPVPVTTEPPGADLFLDGVPVAAVTLDRKDRGRHRVEARLGCLWAQAEVDGASPPPSLVLRLEPSPFRLAVSSAPPGAELLLDGRETGLKTPCEVAREGCDPFEVELHLPGYLPRKAEVDPRRQRGSLELSLEKEPERGALRVLGGSAMMQVFEESRLLGGPGETIPLPAGEHRIRFVDPALRGSAERRVTVEPGKTVTVRAPDFETGRVFLYGRPVEEGKVLVDGRYLEELPLNGNVPLAVGPHRFQVVSPDGRSVSFSWTIRPGDQTRVVDFDKGRAEEP